MMTASVRMMALIGLVITSFKYTASCAVPTLEQAKLAAKPVYNLSMNFYKNWTSKNPEKNLVFSPVSVALALALLEHGASGATKGQLVKVVATPGINIDIMSSYTSLQRELQVDKSGTKFSVANGMFPNKSVSLKEYYVNTLKNCFESEAQTLDFKGETEESRQKINAWISDKTMEKIPELFRNCTLNEDVILVLANAVYFKGAWQNPFPSKLTETRPFFRFGRKQDNQSVPFMFNVGMYGYASTAKAQVLELLYNNTDFSMLIILPTEKDALSNLESDLTHEKVIELHAKIKVQLVKVRLPRFMIQTSIDLKDILTDLGLGRMFTDQAEFERMSKTPLKIDKALHEAFIKVNENGTEAAAATGASSTNSAIQAVFVADHPFIYVILHKPTNAALFLGKVNYVEGG